MCALILLGCGGAPPLVAERPSLVVTNATSSEVWIRGAPCGGELVRLHDVALLPGRTLEVPRLEGCHDFEATTPDGRTVGRQHDVTLRGRMDWRIAR